MNKKRITIYLDEQTDIELNVKLAEVYKEKRVKITKSAVVCALLKIYLELNNEDFAAIDY